MSDDEIVGVLRAAARDGASPVEVAELLGQLCEAGLQQSVLTMYFKLAFPRVPLRTLLDVGAWHRVSGGGMSDKEFNDRLGDYMRTNG